MVNKETICAISTPAGMGGIAVVRVSGAIAKTMVESLLRQQSGRPVALKDRKA